MSIAAEKSLLAKPFLKWAGGKTQLLKEIENRLPEGLATGDVDTYVEPFVGGGAVFFFIAQNFESIKHFYLLDINQDLVHCYNAIKQNVDAVIAELDVLRHTFLAERTTKSRKEFYLTVRKEFNLEKDSHFSLTGKVN